MPRAQDLLGPDPEPPGIRTVAPDVRTLSAPQPAAFDRERLGHGVRVLVAGGGIAAVEAVLALHAQAGPRVEVTVVAANRDVVDRPATVVEPFGGEQARSRLLADALGAAAQLVAGELAVVDPDARVATTADGHRLSFDVLLVATGAAMQQWLPHAVTYPLDGPEALGELLLDLEEGYDEGVAVVVPPGPVWMLPGYELALLTAREVRAMGKHPRLVLVTAEPRPLHAFGRRACAAVSDLLGDAGVELRTGSTVLHDEAGDLTLAPSGERLGRLRALTLPSLRGRAPEGLRTDAHGFLPVDPAGRVEGHPGVFAIGDAAAWPIKHGSLAVQQALVAAAHIARDAGAEVEPEPWTPVLEATLWSGDVDLHLRAGTGVDADAEATVTRSTQGTPKLASLRLEGIFEAPAR